MQARDSRIFRSAGSRPGSVHLPGHHHKAAVLGADDIYGWDLPEEQRKPSTWPIEQIRGKYGFARSQMLVVDDMKPAWEMARNAGIPIAFAGWGRRDCQEISAEMRLLCDFSFDTPEALEKFLFEEG